MTEAHDKLAGIKPGDRVRVTFEAVFMGGFRFDLPHQLAPTYLNAETVSSETFQIERIEPPLKVGDRVKMDDEDCAGTILCICGCDAWVKWDHLDRAQDWETSRLERIP